MLRSRIDRAFARYQQSGDPRALARVFDATAPELYRLGWHLVRDRHAAEDLVQATFLAAIQDAASFDRARGVMPWLCGILTNRALHLRRQSRLRAERAPAATEEVAADPAAAASALELSEAVATAVRVLPDPYRQVLLLHLLHELTPKEVAEALSRPDATVRTQIHRGLDLLRRALPVGIAGLASACAPAPLGLAGVRAAVLAKTGVPAAMAAGARVTFGGVLVMKKVLLAFVAMAFLLLCAWPLLSPADGPAPIARGGVAVLAASAEHAADEADPALPPPAERREVAAPGVDTMAALEVAVRWHDGTPAADVTVRCQPVRTNGDLWLRAARTGPDGVARLPTVAPGKVKVIGDRGGKLELEIAPGTTARAELEIPRGFDVRGVVIDPDDRPFADAEVWLSAVPNSDDGEVVARSGADGTFALRSVASERVLTAVAPGYSCAQCDWVSERRAKEVRVLRLRRAPGELDGVVVDPQGRPVPHARVLVGAVIGAENGKFIGEIRGQDLFPARFLRTDAEGRFRAVGLPLLRWPVWVFAPGFAMWRGDFDMSDQQVTQAAIRLQHGASVHGRATASDGRALAGVHVIGLHVMAPIDSRIALLPAIQGMPTWGLAQATTNGDGSFAIAAIMPGTLTIMAWQGDGDGTGRDKTQLELRDDQDVTWNPELGSPFEIQGRVVDPEGRALAGWELSFRCAKAQAFAQTGPDGEFRCRHAEDVVYQLDIACVRGGSSSHFLFGEVRPGGEPLRIEVPWTHIPSSHFKGKLLLADGRRPKDYWVGGRCSAGISWQTTGSEGDKDGTFVSGIVPPGRYRVMVSGDEFGRRDLGEWDVGRDATVDLGEQRVEVPGDLAFEVVDGNGERRPGDWLQLTDKGSGVQCALLCMERGARSGPLQPGRYLLSTRGDAVVAMEEVAIESGRTTTVRFVVPAGVECFLAVPASPESGESMQLTCCDAMGRMVRKAEVTGHDTRQRLAMSFPAGTYSFELRDRSGRSAATSADIRPSDPPMVIDLPMPATK